MLLAAGLATFGASPASATVWVVDRNNPLCTDAGPGDATTPFCTIRQGALVAAPGDTVSVAAATYREQVSPPTSGTPGMPIRFLAAGPGARILGTDDLSDAAGWSPTATTAWSRPFAPASDPSQVFVDGLRLAEAASESSTTPNSFFYDAAGDVLYVDVGGGNPADGHIVEAGARSHGFNLSGRAHLVVEGFEIEAPNVNGVRAVGAGDLVLRANAISYTGSRGINVDSATGPIVVEGNDVCFSGAVGIRALSTTGLTILGNASHDNANHGIGLSASSGNVIAGNVLHHNAVSDGTSAVGVDLADGSSGNVVRANTSFMNQDSGFEASGGSNDNLFVRNVSRHNGDHGFDTRGATGNRFVSNTSYGNFKDGFSVEGAATDTSFANNLSVANGLLTARFDLFVDSSSAAGFSADYDMFWKSMPGAVVRFDGVSYATLDAFASATGHEAHGLGADPLLVDPGAGDLRLRLGPAVDSADAGAAGFSAKDHDGVLPFDIPAIPDAGAGDPAYADRGAFEYVEAPPVAHLLVSPRRGRAPLTVVADASKSTDDVAIASYEFDFGDGTTAGPQSEPTAAHTYLLPGHYTVTVRVTDLAGFSAVATRRLRVLPPRP
jgi:parallel beta-helix repeat protein